MPEPMIPTQPGYYWAVPGYRPRAAEYLTVVAVERRGEDLLVWGPHRLAPGRLDAWTFVAGPLEPPDLDAPEMPR